jgi:hypothetical protein
MSFHSWLRNLRSRLEKSRAKPTHRRNRSRYSTAPRPRIEALDERIVPAFLAPVDYATGSYPWAVVAADFNNDTLLDLAVANTDDSTVSVLLGNDDGTFQPALNPAPATGANPWSIAVGDFDQDGNRDLATANSSDVSVLMGDGTGQFGAPTSIDFTGFAASVAVGDFTGDGLMDLGVVTGDYGFGYYGFASIHAGDGTGQFSEPKTTFIGYGDFRTATTVDLDGDGVDDLASANAFNGHVEGAVGLLRGDESGYFQPPTLVFTGARDTYDVAVGDVNGDSVADVVTADGIYSVGVSVLLGDGQGGYSAAQTYAAGTWPSDVVLGDFTGDGPIDIAYSSSTGVNVLKGNGDGTFSTLFESPASESTHAVAAGDFNGDGRLDIAVTNLGADSVSVLLNDQSWSPPPPPPPSLRILDATVAEGNSAAASATFTVTLSAASAQPIAVAYTTGNGTANAGSDYQSASGTLAFAPGDTTKTITVVVNGDRLGEANETFVVNLSNPTYANIADGQGVGTILDDEPRISISDVTKSEGRRNKTTLFTFTVTLSAAYDQPVAILFQTVNGTATTSDNDYVAKSGTLTFAPGETTKTITIEVKGDSKRETSETFYLDLFGLSGNALFTKNRGLGTILNDD